MVNYPRVFALFLTAIMVLPAISATMSDLPSGASAAAGGAGGRDGSWHYPERGIEDRAAGRATASVIYAILCPAMFKDYLVPLKEWKTKKGMNAEIYTEEEMLAAYNGPPYVPEFAKVHQYLRRLYVNNSDLKWILIVGDGDQDGETFPVPYIFTNATNDPVMGVPEVGSYIPSDVGYSGLQKDWDANGNGVYGEPGEEDWTPEAYVGRWPVKSTAEVSANVNKVLTYEKNPPAGDWIRTAYFAGALYDLPNIVDSNPDNWSSNAYQYTHDNGRTPILDSAALFPPNMALNMMFDYNQSLGGSYTNANDTLSNPAFVAAMNAGSSLVATASHGWYSGNGINEYHGNGSDPLNQTWQSYESYLFWTDAAALTNGMKLPFIYSSACDVANFTTVWAQMGANRDKSLEQLIKNQNGGAIGFISATNADYWNHLDGNWWLEVNFWKIFFNNSFRPGEALYKDKVAYDAMLKAKGTNLDLGRIRENKAVYNLLGDPEVPIWTDTPRTLGVEYPASLYTIPQQVNVTVRDSATQTPVKNAMVAFTAAGTFARGFTDANGKAQITVDPADPGTVNITATAHNYLPYENTAAVQLTPADLAINASDITYEPKGTIIKDGDQVWFSVNVHNIGRLAASSVAVKVVLGDLSGGTEIGTATAPSVPARGNETVSVAWTAKSGINKISVQVDPQNSIAEFNENNNAANISISAIGVDFVVNPADINVTPVVTINDVFNAANGSMLTIKIFVNNIGVNDAADVFVRLMDNNSDGNRTTIEGDKRIASVPAGGAGNVTFFWNDTSRGTHTLIALADSRNDFLEYTKDNNEASISLYLNAPPGFDDLPAITMDEDRANTAAIDLTQHVQDADNAPTELSYRLVNSTQPEFNATVSPEGIVALRPLANWSGSGKVTVGASDGVSEAVATFSVTVRPVADQPVIDPIPDANLTEGQLFMYNVTASDIDIGDVLSFSDDSALFDINKNTGKIMFTPKRADVGKQTARITVVDTFGLTATATWKFTVIRTNNPPSFLATGEIVIMGTENKLLTYKFNATDPDNDPLTFTSDSTVIPVNSAGLINFTPMRGTAGTYTFNVTVKDNGNMSDSRHVKVIIAAAPVIHTNGGTGMPSWLLPLLIVVIIIAVVAGAGFALSRRSAAKSEDDSKKKQYESLYGSSALTQSQPETGGDEAGGEGGKQDQPTDEQLTTRRCPKCNTIKIQVFEDGGAICNKCGHSFKMK